MPRALGFSFGAAALVVGASVAVGCRTQGRAATAPPPATSSVPRAVDAGREADAPAPPIVTEHPRALVAAPRYAWSECAADIGNVTAALGQAGVPFDVQPIDTDWGATLDDLSRYALVVVPGYLLGAAVSATARERLEAFAEAGGVVVVFKPTGAPDRREALRLAGLTAAVRRRDLLGIRFDAPAPALAAIDTDEERTLPINQAPAREGIEIYVLAPDAGAKTAALAHAVGAPVSAAGPAVTRRPLGRGAIYAVGHDLATFAVSRCYVNCFEPRGDVLRLFLEGALREGAHGHWVQLHTAPGAESSVLLVTHDLDTPDAFRAGPWGPPGALQAQAIEKARGVRASFQVTTDYVRGSYVRATLDALCAEGCALGAHGVLHPATFAKIPRGTCTETPSTYRTAPTLCGEVRVSLAMLAEATGRAPRVWRSPNIAFHPQQLDVLIANGITYDSSFGIGDLPYNLPVEADRASALAMRFGRKPVLELPVALADVDLRASNVDALVTRWESVLRKNVANRSFTTLLVHPTRGEGMSDDNLRVKMDALARLLERAKELDLTTHTLEDVLDFWRARLATKLEATFDSRTGYSGVITFGATTAPGITLEFGDAVGELRCETCGETRIQGRRVVIVGAPAPGSRHAFVATPK